PAGPTAERCTPIVEHLERKNFKVVELENLQDE
ncbi:cyclic di-AMP binding protein CbpA, partial [Enterococcus faecalis]